MKKLMLSMLVMLASTVFATSACAQNLFGSNSTDSPVSVCAINNFTLLPYYLYMEPYGSDYTTVPEGEYIIIVDLDEEAHVYVDGYTYHEDEWGVSWTDLYFGNNPPSDPPIEITDHSASVTITD